MKRYHSFLNQDEVNLRAEKLAEYLLSNQGTVRQAAEQFGISKSTVHKDVAERLSAVNRELWEKMQELLATNKSQRHLRGGQATKEKYQQISSRKEAKHS